MRECTEELFLKDIASHQMTIIRDDGVHRHVRFKKPNSGDMHFDIVTYPHYLVYSGDMGCFVFSRINDMFEFFRMRHREPSARLQINESYWSEKLEAADIPDGYERFATEQLTNHVNDWLDEVEADDDLRERAQDEILSYVDDGEMCARDAMMSFKHDKRHPFQDSWECRFTEYTFRFTWCCYALAWAIRQYDAAKSQSLMERS